VGLQFRAKTGSRSVTLIELLQRSQKLLPLYDLRKFRRWRKAFERRREYGLRVNSATGRLIKLRQNQRRAQLEALGHLLLRDGNGGEEGFLRQRRVRWIAPE